MIFCHLHTTIEYIIVLRPGVACPIAAYKGKNLREGPIRMNPTLSLQGVVKVHAIKKMKNHQCPRNFVVLVKMTTLHANRNL